MKWPGIVRVEVSGEGGLDVHGYATSLIQKSEIAGIFTIFLQVIRPVMASSRSFVIVKFASRTGRPSTVVQSLTTRGNTLAMLALRASTTS